LVPLVVVMAEMDHKVHPDPQVYQVSLETPVLMVCLV